MTMKIRVENVSTNYTAEITEMDQNGETEPVAGRKHILKPGESKNITVWKERHLVVKEVDESAGEIDGTDESESGVSST